MKEDMFRAVIFEAFRSPQFSNFWYNCGVFATYSFPNFRSYCKLSTVNAEKNTPSFITRNNVAKRNLCETPNDLALYT